MPKYPEASTATQTLSPTKVQEDAEQRPVAVTLYGVSVPIESIDERWEDEEFWWRDNPVVRVTYQVTLVDGRQLTIFKNMLTGGWYRLEA